MSRGKRRAPSWRRRRRSRRLCRKARCNFLGPARKRAPSCSTLFGREATEPEDCEGLNIKEVNVFEYCNDGNGFYVSDYESIGYVFRWLLRRRDSRNAKRFHSRMRRGATKEMMSRAAALFYALAAVALTSTAAASAEEKFVDAMLRCPFFANARRHNERYWSMSSDFHLSETQMKNERTYDLRVASVADSYEECLVDRAHFTKILAKIAHEISKGSAVGESRRCAAEALTLLARAGP